MRKTKQKRIPENGQTVAIFALSLVALLGFAALALDGGMLYSDRRHAQNAADTSSLAGATAASIYMQNNPIGYSNFLCGSNDLLATEDEAEQAAIARAASNDYTIDQDISDHHGVETTCVIEDKGIYLDKYIDVTTLITRETQTNLAHLVYPGALINEVEAVARIYPPTPPGYGYAIVALNQDNCSGNQNGVIFSGSSKSTVSGGGVWSNGCLKGDGSSFSVDVTDGIVGYSGESSGTLTNINPTPIQNTNQIPSFSTQITPPDCSGLPDRKVPHGKDATLKPGIYEQIKWSSGTLTLDPGLYCVTGSKGVEVSGGSLFGIDGVTIYLQSGGMTVNGNVEPVDLRAAPDPTSAIPGVLIYMAEGNTSTIKLVGNSNSFYLGAIYAPDGEIYISGSSDTNPTYNTQLIGKNVHVSGGATIDINFQEDKSHERPSFLNLYR